MVVKKRGTKRKLFDPDEVSTYLSQGVERDLSEAIHAYCGGPSYKHGVLRYALNRQRQELLKKYCSPKQDVERLERETFNKFHDINAHMAEVNDHIKKIVAGIPARVNRRNTKTENILLRAKALMNYVLGPVSWEEVYQAAKNSAGSSLGVPFSDTSLERKLTFPLSSTDRAAHVFDEYILWDHDLRVEMLRFNAPMGLFTHMYEIVNGSRATTVDKTTDKRRMICVEPTVNMYLQQGLMLVMYNRLKKVGLDLERLPELHRQMAKLASIDKLNATIDWSSASDCVAIELLRWLLPPKWFDMVWTLRCDYAQFTGADVALNMISTMGNAVTFPLETLVFWTMAHAVLLESKNSQTLFPEWDELKSVSVFGDDCIVPTFAASRYIEVMEEVGFIVNSEKSFYGAEPFRESCGGDYLAGFDVRPFNLRAPTSTKLSALEPWLYVIGNSLLTKYIQYFGEMHLAYGHWFWERWTKLFQKHKLELKVVPEDFPDDAGLKIAPYLEQFASTYPVKLSRIDVSDHHTYTFRYLRFRYWEREDIDDGLRYATWLKSPSPSIFDTVGPVEKSLRSQRKRGGYVVAKGLTGHWSVPVISRRASP